MRSIIVRSTAKVNIGLQVLGMRSDGYHNLNTIFQELKFHDLIHLSEITSGCELSSTDPHFKEIEANTCKKAYDLVVSMSKLNTGVKIHVEKNIPYGSGLGGGSSNGAAVIKGMNALFELGLDRKEMKSMAKNIGADVPFFISGETQLGEETGAKLTPIKHKHIYSFLLILPEISISTAWAYKALKNGLFYTRDKVNFADFFKRDKIPFELFKNDFERIVIPAYPEIGVIKESLMKCGARYASLSGSGSTVFGMFDDDTAAKTAESVLKSDYRTILTSSIIS